MGYPDPLDTQAQEAEEASRKDKHFQTLSRETEDFKWLMSDKRGRRFMWRLLTLTAPFINAFTGNSETFFRCGKQSIGQTMLADINTHCPEKYELMVKEQTK